MQASLNQLSEILAERAGRQFDMPFREELKLIINYWRSSLIVQSLNAKPKDRQFFTRWLEIPLVRVKQSDFPGFPDCTILRTKCKLPMPVRANSKLFDFVGKLDKMTATPLKEPYQINALLGGKYSGNKVRTALINDYIYVFGQEVLAGLAVQMIPDDLESFKSFCGEIGVTDCYSDDLPYPVSGDFQQRIIQAVIATEFRMPAKSQTTEQEVEIANE